MDKLVEQGGRHLRIAKCAGPFGETQVGGDHHAASIAGLMITTEAMVAEAPKKNEPAGGGHGGGGMGVMGGMDF